MAVGPWEWWKLRHRPKFPGSLMRRPSGRPAGCLLANHLELRAPLSPGRPRHRMVDVEPRKPRHADDGRLIGAYAHHFGR